LISVTSYDHDSAAIVFETLNDRGLSLTTSELLRGYVLRQTSPQQRKRIATRWSELGERLGRRIREDEFLRHWWITHEGDLKSKSLYRAIRDGLARDKFDSSTLVAELAADARSYRDIRIGVAHRRELETEIRTIAALRSKSLYPAALAAVATKSEQTREVARVLRSLSTLHVRHTLICARENGDFENVAFHVAKAIRRGDLETCEKRIRHLMPSDRDFEASFTEARVPRHHLQKYLLSELERAMRPNSDEIDVSARITVEHIYPHRPEGRKWREHEEFIHRLGNLTLLSGRLNSKIQNATFSKKKPKYEESSMLMTKSLAAEFDRWSPGAVLQRQRQLATLAVVAWPGGDGAHRT
jgi:hypothetical protein